MNFKETLIDCLRGILRCARGAQEPRFISKYVEVTIDTPNGYELYPFGVWRRVTWQFGDSPEQAINQGFLKYSAVFHLTSPDNPNSDIS